MASMVHSTPPIRGGDCGGDEGDMSPQYSDRGDDMPYVPPPQNSLVSACHSVA